MSSPTMFTLLIMLTIFIHTLSFCLKLCAWALLSVHIQVPIPWPGGVSGLTVIATRRQLPCDARLQPCQAVQRAAVVQPGTAAVRPRCIDQRRPSRQPHLDWSLAPLVALASALHSRTPVHQESGETCQILSNTNTLIQTLALQRKTLAQG